MKKRRIVKEEKVKNSASSEMTGNSSGVMGRNTALLEKMNSEQDPNKLADILINAIVKEPKKKKVPSSSSEVPTSVTSPSSSSKSSSSTSSVRSAEFKRVVNIAQIPRKQSILCKLMVKDHEKVSLAKRFDVPEILFFAANLTLTWRDAHSLSISGSIEGHIGYGDNEILSPDAITTQFDTLLLNNVNTNAVLKFEEEKEYDDEIKADGNIDLAEIACQYFEMEI